MRPLAELQRACSSLTCALLALTLAAVLQLGSAAAAGSGRWTPKVEWATNRYAIHMMLMPGDGAPHHSRILWFSGESGDTPTFFGGLWGWAPATDDCASYPSSSFTEITPTLVGYNVFCSGHAPLADGRLLVAGGHSAVVGNYGENMAAILNPGSGTVAGTWTGVGPMNSPRWYPTVTTLRDGRALVTAGYQHRQHRVFGGRIGGSVPSSPTGDKVKRFAPIAGGGWDPEVLPDPDPNPAAFPGRPAPRERHTGVDRTEVSGFEGQVYYGGSDENGTALGDVWLLKRSPNVTGADYGYAWKKLSPVGTNQPDARRNHTAIAADNGTVIVFGGKRADGVVTDEVWRLSPNGGVGRWDRVNATGGPARMSHAAFYNEMAIREGNPGVDKFVKRMVVYGGVASEGAAPTDNKVYELRFDPNDPTVATWYEMTDTALVGTSAGFPENTPMAPLPRLGHAAVGDTRLLNNLTPGDNTTTKYKISYVFGGALGSGNSSNELWMLYLFTSGKHGWIRRPTSGTPPSVRAHHSMVADPQQGSFTGPRLYVHGGDSAGELADRNVYVIDPYIFGSGHWYRWSQSADATTGHTAVLERHETHARVGEIYNPVANAWSALPSAPLLEHSYPATFAVSGGSSAGGRVVSLSGEDNLTRFIDLPGPGSSTGNWQPFTNGALGFTAESAVLYRPGRILVAGGNTGGIITGDTRTLNATSTTSSWQTSGSMTPRVYHNLVVLPDGKVLATGGASTDEDYNDHAVLEPQIWDPEANSGSGSWTGLGTLSSSSAVRGYHSTALLLPDGRVLCAGGQGDGGEGDASHPDQYRADLYCPPYLFDAGGALAARPVVSSAPVRVSYGEKFTLCMSGTDAALAKVSLVRPGAATHGFDQNQRFLWLTAEAAPSGAGSPRFLVTAPTDASDAPPGDYMLFALSAAGTPSIARWIRIGGTNGQTGHPTMVNNLAKICSQGTSVQLQWTPPDGDSLTATTCPRPAALYELRYRQGLMPGWSEFASATSATGMPLPNDPVPGQPQSISVGDLTPNTQYTFRLISKNYSSGNGNWSALGNALTFTTYEEECGGSGGGGGGCCHEGASARQARGMWLRRPAGGATDASFLENTLLANVAPGQPTTDRMRLPFGPKWSMDGAFVRLSRSGSMGTRFNRVRLLGVNLAADQEVFTSDGEILSGSLSPPTQVLHSDGRDLSAALAADSPFDGHPGDTLEVEFADAAPMRIALETSLAQLVTLPNRTGIDIQCETAEGWQTVAHHDPRERRADALHVVPSANRVRLVFRGDHRLHGVARFEQGEAPIVTTYDPTSLLHSRIGEVSSTLTAEGALLAPGEHMVARFDASTADGSTTDWFLEVVGEHAEISGTGVSTNRGGHSDIRPLRLSLEQNKPNPFGDETRIEFELPTSAQVRVEIFDLLGRRVATLLDGNRESGRHSVFWDRRTVGGTRATAGVYTCRLTAGSKEEKRSIIVFQ